MIGVLVLVVYVATAALAGLGVALTAANLPPGRELKIAVGIVAGLLAIQAVIAAVRVFGGAELP